MRQTDREQNLNYTLGNVFGSLDEPSFEVRPTPHTIPFESKPKDVQIVNNIYQHKVGPQTQSMQQAQNVLGHRKNIIRENREWLRTVFKDQQHLFYGIKTYRDHFQHKPSIYSNEMNYMAWETAKNLYKKYYDETSRTLHKSLYVHSSRPDYLSSKLVVATLINMILTASKHYPPSKNTIIYYPARSLAKTASNLEEAKILSNDLTDSNNQRKYLIITDISRNQDDYTDAQKRYLKETLTLGIQNYRAQNNKSLILHFTNQATPENILRQLEDVDELWYSTGKIVDVSQWVDGEPASLFESNQNNVYRRVTSGFDGNAVQDRQYRQDLLKQQKAEKLMENRVPGTKQYKREFLQELVDKRLGKYGVK